MKRWQFYLLLLLCVASALWSSGVVPAIVPAAVPTANLLGNSTRFVIAKTPQTFTAGDCLTVDASNNMTDSGIATCGGAGTSVSSFNTRTGAVVSATNDYNFNQLAGSLATSQVGTPQGNGTKVQLSTGSTSTNHCVEFDANGNTIDAGFQCVSNATQGGIYPAFTPVVDGSYTWANQQTASDTFTNNIVYLSAPQLAGDNIQAREIAAPGTTPWSITIAVITTFNGGSAGSGTGCGIEVRDSVGGHLEAVINDDNNGSGDPQAHIIAGTLTSWSGQTTTTTSHVSTMGFLKVRDDGTNLTFTSGIDGVNVQTVGTRPVSGFANTPNKVGFFIQNENAASTTGCAFFSWIQGT